LRRVDELVTIKVLVRVSHVPSVDKEADQALLEALSTSHPKACVTLSVDKVPLHRKGIGSPNYPVDSL
jgi:hypothetical protein